MEKISAVLIAKDEAAVIERCLKSLRGVDEIVVLDTGSADRTVHIVEAAGARVARCEPTVPFHFADARNRATALAANEWILSVDADEVLRPGSMGKIRKAIQNASGATAFLTTFINRPEIGADRTVAIRKTKVFRRTCWAWRYRVHEQLVATVDPAPVEVIEGAVIEHLPVPDKSKRHGQNVELLRLCIAENPEYLRAHRHLGQELMLDKKWAQAIPPLAHYVEKTNEGALEKSESMMRVGQCYAELGRMESALQWFDLSAAEDGRRREPLYQAAWHLIRTARTVLDLEAARAYLLRLLEVPSSTRPNSHHDYPAAWGDEPRKMLAFIRDQIARAVPAGKP